METNELILQLLADASPVRRLPGVNQRVLRWLALAAATAIAGIAALGPRSDLPVKAADGSFLAQAAALALVWITCAWGAFEQSVPSFERSLRFKLLPAGALLVWITVLSLGVAHSPELRAELKPLCVARIFGIGLLPFAVSLHMLRKASPGRPGLTGFLAAVGAFSTGALATQFLCKVDRPFHLLIWHVVPTIILGFLGARAGRAVLRRRGEFTAFEPAD